ncbi:MAG: hypothetical protein V4650_09430 [Pseudomonadota bacterium]
MSNPEDPLESNLLRDGFVHLPAAIPSDVLAAADSFATTREASIHFDGRGWGQCFAPDAVLIALVESCRATIERLRGSPLCRLGVPPHPMAPHRDVGQLAYVRAAATCRGYNAHVDGAPYPGQLQLTRHAALLGVALTPALDANCGNFVVWPRSHRRIARALHELPPGSDGVGALRAGWPVLEDETPERLRLAAGDAVLLHALTLHGTACRTRPGTRRMAFFRLDARRLASDDLAGFADLWSDWQGIDAALRAMHD